MSFTFIEFLSLFLSAMALCVLKGLLQQYVQSLFEEGVISDQFFQILSMRSADETESAVQSINSYCHDVGALISELKSYIGLPDIEFSRLAMLAREAELKSLRIGAEHMKLACASFIQACDEENKGKFCHALSWMKNEFDITRSKFEAFVKMEQKIIRLESRQQGSCRCAAAKVTSDSVSSS